MDYVNNVDEICVLLKKVLVIEVVLGVLGLIQFMGKTARLLRFKDHCPDNNHRE